MGFSFRQIFCSLMRSRVVSHWHGLRQSPPPLSTDMERELAVAVALARQAGRIVMDVYATDFAVAWKGANDPVTDADRQGNDLIVQGLCESFPGDAVVAEEGSQPVASPPAPASVSRVWYVDPLDGTKEFIAGNGEFSVMIGLALDGRAHLGVVYRPDNDVLYAGVVGTGAWMEQHGTRVAMAIPVQDAGRPLILATSRSHRHPIADRIARAIGVGKEIPLGSVGLKIGMIARGDADAYVEPGPATSVWDACAPDAILRAAGGQFTTILGHPVVYGGLPLNNPHGLLATNGCCHARLVQALRPVAQDLGLHA